MLNSWFYIPTLYLSTVYISTVSIMYLLCSNVWYYIVLRKTNDFFSKNSLVSNLKKKRILTVLKTFGIKRTQRCACGGVRRNIFLNINMYVAARSLPVLKNDVTHFPSRFIFTLTHIGTFMTRGYYVYRISSECYSTCFN